MTGSQKQTIVVVDDSPSMKILFEKAVESLAVDLTIFDSTEGSWAYLQDHRPDLLFINIKMPGKDGLTYLKELRELPLHSDTSVVMISSKDYAQDRSVAEELGALNFITKPTPIRVIADLILNHLNVDSA